MEAVKKQKRSLVKKELKAKNAKKKYYAYAKYLRISPIKLNYIAREIQGYDYIHAMATLSVMSQKGACLLSKVIKSATYNLLVDNSNIAEEELRIAVLRIEQGPRMKRMWRRGKGRADVLLKRMAHVYVEVEIKRS